MSNLQMQVESAIDRSGARARIQSHLGDVVVLDVTGGNVLLQFTGFCSGCPLQPMTFISQLRPAIEGIDGVRSLAVQGQRISPYAEKRMAALADVGPRTSLTLLQSAVG